MDAIEKRNRQWHHLSSGMGSRVLNISPIEASIFRASWTRLPHCHVNSLKTEYHCLSHKHYLYHHIHHTRLFLRNFACPSLFSPSSTESANSGWQTTQDTYNTTVRYSRGS